MASKTWSVGVIGYGFSAKIFHIPFVQEVPEFSLSAIVQRTPKPGDNAAEDHPGVKCYRSAEEMVTDSAIEVVVITTDPTSHYELSKLALEAGKHVVCEKPFTPTSKEAEELVALAKKQDKVLAVYQNRRWDADFVTVSKLVKSGALGRVVEFETHFDRHRPEQPHPAVSKWKNKVFPGSGAIFDLGTHLLDQTVHLFGFPERVTGFITTQRENSNGFEDSFTVLLHYKNGMLATVKAAVVSLESEQLRFWIRGDKGSYKKFHLDIQEDQLRGGMKPGENGFGREPSERYGTLTTSKFGLPVKEVFPTVEPPTWTEYYRKLARALAGQDVAPASGAEALRVIRLIELAKESSKLGKTLNVNV